MLWSIKRQALTKETAPAVKRTSLKHSARQAIFFLLNFIFFFVRNWQKAWSLNVSAWLFVFEIAFSRRLFHLAFSRKQKFANLILLRLRLSRRKFSVCICRMEQKTKRNPPSAKRNLWVLFFLYGLQHRMDIIRKHTARCAKYIFLLSFFSSNLAEGAITRREARFFFWFRFFFFRTHLAKNAGTRREARNFFFGFSVSARTWQKARAQGAKRKFFVVSVFLFQITFSRKRRHEARSAKKFFWGVFFFSSHLEEGPGTRQGAGTAPRKEKRKKKKKKKKRFATQP